MRSTSNNHSLNGQGKRHEGISSARALLGDRRAAEAPPFKPLKEPAAKAVCQPGHSQVDEQQQAQLGAELHGQRHQACRQQAGGKTQAGLAWQTCSWAEQLLDVRVHSRRSSMVHGNAVQHSRVNAGCITAGRRAPAKSWVTGVEGARMRKPSRAVWKLMAAQEGRGHWGLNDLAVQPGGRNTRCTHWQ